MEFSGLWTIYLKRIIQEIFIFIDHINIFNNFTPSVKKTRMTTSTEALLKTLKSFKIQSPPHRYQAFPLLKWLSNQTLEGKTGKNVHIDPQTTEI